MYRLFLNTNLTREEMMYKILRITNKTLRDKWTDPWHIGIATMDNVEYDITSNDCVVMLSTNDKNSIEVLYDNLNFGMLLIINNEFFKVKSNNEYEKELLDILPNSLGVDNNKIFTGMKLINDIINHREEKYKR